MTPLASNVVAAVSGGSISDSQVLVALITVGGSIIIPYVTYSLSNRKKQKNNQSTVNSVEPTNYASYEAIIRRQEAESDRCAKVAESREKIIADLRTNEGKLYNTIEELRTEIDKLKHMREYSVHAKKITDSKKQS